MTRYSNQNNICIPDIEIMSLRVDPYTGIDERFDTFVTGLLLYNES
jgi:hypothetical protein